MLTVKINKIEFQPEPKTTQLKKNFKLGKKRIRILSTQRSKEKNSFDKKKPKQRQQQQKCQENGTHSSQKKKEK